MASVDVDTLCIERKREDISHLSEEEKVLRCKELKLIRTTKVNQLGALADIDYAKNLLKNMSKNSIRRNHVIPDGWTDKKLLKLLSDNRIFKIETDIGTVEIPLKLSNGYWNSASVDRLDDTKGYEFTNIQIIPRFLNVNEQRMNKIGPEEIKEIVKLREITQDVENLTEVSNLMIDYNSYNFFIDLQAMQRIT